MTFSEICCTVATGVAVKNHSNSARNVCRKKAAQIFLVENSQLEDILCPTPPPEGIAQPVELTYFLVLLLALKKAPDLINDIQHWKLIKQYFDTESADQNEFFCKKPSGANFFQYLHDAS